ncbi:MAG: class I SAM-dependent DNA methyltransferase [Candidatus Binataceae bacterium]
MRSGATWGHYHAARANLKLAAAAPTHAGLGTPNFVAKLRAMEHSIYEFPEIFRRVHKERPDEIADEVRFLRRVWSRHHPRPVRRVLDIASGNSPHGQSLARDGIEVVGIDRSPTMITAGRRESRGVCGIRFYRRAIERFRIPERPFDVAFFMSETFPVMTTNQAIISHMRCVGRLLQRGGLYCVDVDRMDGVRALHMRKIWRATTMKVGNAAVRVRAFNRPMPWYSGIYSAFDLECRIKTPAAAVTTRDLIPLRYTLPCTLDLIARASGMFRTLAVYTDLSVTEPLERCERRWLGVLQRV